jgi:asparagine synthase (glutamine-hydrolysing)
MAGVIGHRGPDDQGVWFQESTGIGLSHTRLSVIDLTPEGHQPMHSSSGRYTICFNGEIYNFNEIRADLESRGVRFRGHSDTEVLLEGIQAYGLEEMVDRCIGMFAFGLWDAESGTLSLVRDRLGIKPLYWSCSGELAVFGSELKSMLASGLLKRDLDQHAVSAYLTLGYVPAPHSIFQGVHKLEPGHVARITCVDGQLHSTCHVYWSAREVAIRAKGDPFVGSEESMIDHLDEVIGTAVEDRMVSDVPLGAFLSGGIDSTLVVAMMQERSTVPIKTFTIGFNEDLYDESEAARAIASHLGTDHTEMIVTPEDSLAVIPLIPDLFDEPFADSSQIPTYLVSKLARTEVTVSLSGDGGDELFGGYNRYTSGLDIFRKISLLPRFSRRMISRGIRTLPPGAWDFLYQVPHSMSRGRLRKRRLGTAMHKLANAIGARDNHEYYQRVLSTWPDAAKVLPSVVAGSRLDPDVFTAQFEFAEQMFLADTRSYLVDDILVKVDRASMGVSLEARVPLLDHRVFEAAWRLPMSLRLNNRVGKVALRSLLARRLPRNLYERPKMGFGVPVVKWLKHDLRDWAESLLQPADLESIGLDPVVVRHAWSQLVDTNLDLSAQIWTILMLRAWHDRWVRQ